MGCKISATNKAEIFLKLRLWVTFNMKQSIILLISASEAMMVFYHAKSFQASDLGLEMFVGSGQPQVLRPVGPVLQLGQNLAVVHVQLKIRQVPCFREKLGTIPEGCKIKKGVKQRNTVR